MSLRVLIVDDEPLARARMRTLLSDCRSPVVMPPSDAGNAAQALELLEQRPFDALLLDVHMPGADGLALARSLRTRPLPPAVVFVTAHAEHAVAAFDLEAVDYLTKPVRLERLEVALQKVERMLHARASRASEQPGEVLLIQDRGRTERVPIGEVLYFKAELKYVTVRTMTRNYILDASLSELEVRHETHFLRVHRNALVARRAIRALEKHYDPEEGEGWAVRMNGIDELLAVSRRQLSAVREAIAGKVA